ncbi:hypothetical protein ABZ342_31020 [Amycolatopsis sp. NPDC005961]|uniref:Uncharacterized protein n=1 Tax=Amycolatopsis camponoti TaxID=2606593 RepID=A0A6I8LT79_9PSEU|nr:hypothetical protein [Amycolatopsis camponoti]VVJ18309.1 Uncharacterised protein [Amycolatopsis camponoti]
MDADLIISLVTAAAASGLVKAVASIGLEWQRRRKRKKIKISRDGEPAEIDLDEPEQARIYAAEYLSRHGKKESGGGE